MITHSQWMRSTYDTFRKRSPALKKVDDALQKYHATAIGTGWERSEALHSLGQALMHWKGEKQEEGKSWRSSIRNSRGAVEELDRQVERLSAIVIATLPDEQAVQELDAAGFTLNQLFHHKQLKTRAAASGRMKAAVTEALKFDRMLRDGEKGRKEWRERTSADNYKKGLHDARFGGEDSDRTGERVMRAAGGEVSSRYATAAAHTMDPGPILRALTSQTDTRKLMRLAKDAQQSLGKELFSSVAHLAPGLGTLLAAKDVIVQIRKVKQARDNVEQARQAVTSIRKGTAVEALKAVETLLQRELQKEKRAAASATGELFAGITFPPVASLAGAAAKAASFLETAYQAVKDWEQKEAGNYFLKGKEIHDSIFIACPILGAYFLACSTRSTVLNFAVRGIGDAGWMDYIEDLNRQVDSVVERARELIAQSRYEIPNMPLLAMSADARWQQFKRDQSCVVDAAGNRNIRSEETLREMYREVEKRESHFKKLHEYQKKGWLYKKLHRPPPSMTARFGDYGPAGVP